MELSAHRFLPLDPEWGRNVNWCRKQLSFIYLCFFPLLWIWKREKSYECDRAEWWTAQACSITDWTLEIYRKGEGPSITGRKRDLYLRTGVVYIKGSKVIRFLPSVWLSWSPMSHYQASPFSSSVTCSYPQAVGRELSWIREHGRCLSDGLPKERPCQGNVATSRSEPENSFW